MSHLLDGLWLHSGVSLVFTGSLGIRQETSEEEEDGGRELAPFFLSLSLLLFSHGAQSMERAALTMGPLRIPWSPRELWCVECSDFVDGKLFHYYQFLGEQKWGNRTSGPVNFSPLLSQLSSSPEAWWQMQLGCWWHCIEGVHGNSTRDSLLIWPQQSEKSFDGSTDRKLLSVVLLATNPLILTIKVHWL